MMRLSVPSTEGLANLQTLCIACVASLVLAGFSARHNLVPVRAYYATRPVKTRANPGGARDRLWLKHKAYETGGNVARLEQHDRERLNRMTHGQGDSVLRYYADHKEEHP